MSSTLHGVVFACSSIPKPMELPVSKESQH